MPIYEYKVVPAPEKGQKSKTLKGTRERFALALETLMNELGAQGWEYVRADMLPCEERAGLTGTATVYQNMLVFRRARGADPAAEPAFVHRAPPAEPAAPQAPVVSPEADSAAGQVQGQKTTAGAAAAAAAAALTAYRDRTHESAPKLGPARGD